MLPVNGYHIGNVNSTNARFSSISILLISEAKTLCIKLVTVNMYLDLYTVNMYLDLYTVNMYLDDIK